MRQEVRATITITYDADARLAEDALCLEIHDDIVRLLDPDSGSRVEAVNLTIDRIQEEAEIYGNA